MVPAVGTTTSTARHGRVWDLGGAQAGDLLVVNDTRVKARSRRAGGGRSELLVLEPRETASGCVCSTGSMVMCSPSMEHRLL